MRLFFALLLACNIHAQVVKKCDVQPILDKIEKTEVKVVKVKTLKKYRALNLSKDMKKKFRYNVVRADYVVRDKKRTMYFDVSLVPIKY